MTFLNATLIFGALAAGVPIVLHLIAKKEPRREVFPAIRFLTKKFDTNRTRLRVKRWWLLLLRVLALIALAAALARPTIHRDLSVAWLSIALVVAAGLAMLVLATLAVVRGMQKRTAFALAVVGGLLCLSGFGWGGYTLASGERAEVSLSSPIAVAVLVDNSAVSSWATPSGSHLEDIQDRAMQVLRSLPATSRAAIVDRSARPPAFAVDIPAAMAQLDQLEPRQVNASMESRLRSAARLLGTSELKSKFLIAITDGSVSSWTPGPPEAVAADGVEVVIIDVGDFDAFNRRLDLGGNDFTPARKQPHTLVGSVTIEKRSTATSAPNDPTSVQVELRLFDEDPSKPLIRNGDLVLPGSQVVDRTSLQVTPGTRSQFELMTPPLDEGIHHLNLELVGTDSFAIDDRRAITLSVEKPPRVLVVASDPLQSDVVAWAISAPREPAHPDAEFSIDEVAFDDVLGLRLNDYAAVFLLDPPMDLVQDDSLHSFVASGGSCFMSLGPSFRPGQLSEGVVAKRIWRVPDEGTFFQTLRANHPILMPLEKDSQSVRWSDFLVQRYWQFGNSENAQTLMQFAGTNHPALFSFAEGDGRWLVLTTPLTNRVDDNSISPSDYYESRWNRLFGVNSWPTFILVHQIAEFLARPNQSSYNTLVGSSISLRVGEASGAEIASDADGSTRWQLFVPELVTPMPISTSADAEFVQISDVSVAGNYWLRSSNRNVGFAANLATEAVVTRKVDAATWDGWFGTGDYQRVRDVKDIEFLGGQRDIAVSLRSPALLFAMAVFLFEQLLGNRFYQSPKSGVAVPDVGDSRHRFWGRLSAWLPRWNGSGARSA